MEGKQEILDAIKDLKQDIISVGEDLRGNGGFNEGLIPAFKRHSLEDKIMEKALNERMEDISEQLSNIKKEKPKEGIWKWIEEHLNTDVNILKYYLGGW